MYLLCGISDIKFAAVEGVVIVSVCDGLVVGCSLCGENTTDGDQWTDGVIGFFFDGLREGETIVGFCEGGRFRLDLVL
jgi:hypothetical protein